MRILFGIFHPKHVYVFKNTIDNLAKKGHEIKIVAVNKEITEYLLEYFNMPYTIIGQNQPKLYKKVFALPKLEYRIYKIAKEFKPDIFVGRTSPYLAHVSAILNKYYIIFGDTETARSVHKISMPFASSKVTPDCYKLDHGKKHIRFDGYFELGYLHPKYFEPDMMVLDEIGLNKDERFIILRCVAWSASHDRGDRGFTDKKKVVEMLEEYGRVFITSENELPRELEKYRIAIAPEKIHHLMYYADLFMGESATMAAESAVLGTPAIFVSTSRRGYTDELESKYDMLYTFSDPHNAQEKALEKAVELLRDGSAKKKWQEKREMLLNETIDVTKFMTEFIDGYPESLLNLKR